MTEVTSRCWQIQATRPAQYELRTVTDIFDPQNDALLSAGRGAGSRRFVVVDEQVYRHQGERIRAYFEQRGVAACIVRASAGESGKTLDAWLRIVRTLEQFPIHRRDEPIIAIGGGVVTDVVGFVASSYRRGIPHIKVPTTLMGYVDAAIGVKTGVNLDGHKNRLGSFEPPHAVLLDRRLLATVTPRHLRNGLCEIIKLAVILDEALFTLLESSGPESLDAAFQNPAGTRILDLAIDDMVRELTPNLYEDVLARKVDFGHTFSYGLEAQSDGELLHGEAVLLDILVSAAIAYQRGAIEMAAIQRLFTLVNDLGIEPMTEYLQADLMWRALQDRVEHRNGNQHIPLPTAIGRGVFANDVQRAELSTAIDTLRAWAIQDERVTHEGPGGIPRGRRQEEMRTA